MIDFPCAVLDNLQDSFAGELADQVTLIIADSRNLDWKLGRLNDVLDGYGVETIQGRFVNKLFRTTQALYINLGNPYEPTVLYDTEQGRFIIGAWGDWFERYEVSRELE